MTDPTFETREAYERWERNTRNIIGMHYYMGNDVNVDDGHAQIARVKAAHAHLLKGQDDANF